MAVHAHEDGGMRAGDGVEVLAGGELGAGPEGVVPAASGEPLAFALGRHLLRDAGLHLFERLRALDVHAQLGEAA